MDIISGSLNDGVRRKRPDSRSRPAPKNFSPPDRYPQSEFSRIHSIPVMDSIPEGYPQFGTAMIWRSPARD